MITDSYPPIGSTGTYRGVQVKTKFYSSKHNKIMKKARTITAKGTETINNVMSFISIGLLIGFIVTVTYHIATSGITDGYFNGF